MEDCIFCKIMNGKIPSSTVYEDDLVKAILDISPVTNGHMMIIPKNHFNSIEDIDEEVLAHVMEVAKKMIVLLKEKLGAEGVTLVQNNGLGQEIKHFHLHLVPRYSGDGLVFEANKNMLNPIDETLNKIKP